MRNNSIAIAFIILLATSCGKTEEPTQIGEYFFPLEVGKYKCYSMDSIIHDAFAATTDTLHYFIKETVESSFTDNAGNEAFKLKVEFTFDTSLMWLFNKYVTVQKDLYSAQRVDNDLRIVKLSFPIRDRKSWDENEYNVLDKQLNRYVNTYMSFSLNNVIYPETITIDKGDNEDPFFRFYGREVYAKNIGLILQEYINTETQQGKTKGNEYTKSLYKTNW